MPNQGPTPEPWGITKSETPEFYNNEWYVDGAGEDVESVAIVNGEANARLIVAAPETAEQRDELLEALEGIVAASRKGKCIEGCGGHTTGLCSRLCRQVAAAIAKAKGE